MASLNHSELFKFLFQEEGEKKEKEGEEEEKEVEKEEKEEGEEGLKLKGII